MPTEQSTAPIATNTARSPVTPRRVYRAVAIAESITWSLLIVGMVLKYAAGLGAAPVLIAGSIHGFVFITYALLAALIGVNQQWGPVRIVAAVATAVVPYATIPFDRHLERRNLLDGDWHREATGSPRDHVWTRRFLRWLVRHPRTFVALFILGVIAIMSALLLIGPPGGWGAK
ncbi:MAG: DUF3817 domain-containing protein [Actinobacteria bacterium]|nr:DUF3817 domain-containing protein [Actinomycetota bacterium]